MWKVRESDSQGANHYKVIYKNELIPCTLKVIPRNGKVIPLKSNTCHSW